MKIAYFGFDLFYDCLEQLIYNGHEIVKIFTCNVDEVYESNKKVYNFAIKNAIDITSEKVTAQMISELESTGCDLIFCAGYYYKIPVSSTIPGVNLHPSLLPQGRGPWPFPNVILKKLPVTGVTIHELSDGFDTGKIVLQSVIPVFQDENLESLTIKSIDAAVQIVDKFAKSPFDYLANAYPQNFGEYWSEPDVNAMTFTSEDSFEKIDLITRAFYGFGCFFKMHDKILHIAKAKCTRKRLNSSEHAETVLRINGGYLHIIKMC